MSSEKQLSQIYIFSDKSEIIDTVSYILMNIIDYSETIDDRTPSNFDNPSSLLDSNESYSTSCSSIESRDSENSDDTFLNKMDQYDLNTFIKKFSKNFQLDENTLILSLMHIDKILSKDFVITDKNVRYLFCTSMIVSQKFYEDEPIDNNIYAKYVGISAAELTQLELEFLEMLDYNLFVSDEKFYNYKNRMASLYKNNLS